MSAVVAIWDAAGCPVPNWQGKARTTRPAPDPRPGVCALTGTAGPVWDACHVISDMFTRRDRLPHRHVDPAGVAFSAPAAWAFRERSAMQRPHSLTAGVWRQLTPTSLWDALVALPTNQRDIVCVPQSRQKHLVPYAAHGIVRVDDESLPWGAGDVDRLGTYRALRALGFGEVALTEPVPRWPTLVKLPPDARQFAVLRWDDLSPWRKHAAYLDVAARATRKEKAT